MTCCEHYQWQYSCWVIVSRYTSLLYRCSLPNIVKLCVWRRKKLSIFIHPYFLQATLLHLGIQAMHNICGSRHHNSWPKSHHDGKDLIHTIYDQGSGADGGKGEQEMLTWSGKMRVNGEQVAQSMVMLRNTRKMCAIKPEIMHGSLSDTDILFQMTWKNEWIRAGKKSRCYTLPEWFYSEWMSPQEKFIECWMTMIVWGLLVLLLMPVSDRNFASQGHWESNFGSLYEHPSSSRTTSLGDLLL